MLGLLILVNQTINQFNSGSVARMRKKQEYADRRNSKKRKR